MEMDRCLTDDEVFAIVSGSSVDTLIGQAMLHADRCRSCRVLLAEETKAARSECPERLPRLGRYALRGVLGAGAAGLVYEAFDENLGRRVAFKVVRPRQGGAAEIPRLQREARAMARLWHPNVVAVFDAGDYEGGVFIAMELVEGSTLSQWLTAEPRSWIDVVRMFIAAGHGLVAAHEAGLVHRDFKADNVLVGKDGRPRVTDFGLARASSGQEDGGREIHAAAPTVPIQTALLTLTEADGGLAGTPAFMAPEQLRGTRADAATDQFNFCASLYAALYGALPFGAPGTEDRESFAARVLGGHLQPPPQRSEVPDRVFRVLARGLQVQRSARFESMATLLTALEGTLPPARRRLPKATLGVIAAAAATVVMLVGGAARKMVPAPQPPTMSRLVPAQPPTPEPAARQPAAAVMSPTAFAPAVPPPPQVHAPHRSREQRRAKPLYVQESRPAPARREEAPPETRQELGDRIKNPYVE